MVMIVLRTLEKYIAFLAFPLLVISCREESPLKPGGVVEANSAYRRHFGEPPAVKAGKAYARVGYLPVLNSPDTLRPVPLYIYDEKNQLTGLLARLVSGELILPQVGNLYNPFPQNMTVRIEPLSGKTLMLKLSVDQQSSFDRPAVINALVETALQFSEYTRVVVTVNDQPIEEMPESGYAADPNRVLDPEPPALIMIAGIWGEGEALAEELVVNFDRPVTVDRFILTHTDGNKVEGKYYASVFQMAVVVHPDRPSDIREGRKLHIDWQVTDALGRTGRGKQVLPIQRLVHEVHLGELQKK